MVAEVQSLLIQRLTAAAGQSVDADAQLAPREVDAYAQQLLNPERLANVAPALWVEIDGGSLSSAGGDLFGGDHRNDLILLARNAASGKSLAHDGARLLSWTIAQLRALRIPIGGNMATVERITWQRLGSDANARIWSARVTATFSSIS